ncbi:MAG TPA: SCO family protein [Nocardioidaceae bacterium]|nr:SCO family protein [Nocardioidaceae bacterium]
MPERPHLRRRRAAAMLAAATVAVLAGCGGAESGSPTSAFTETNPDGKHGAVLTDQYVVPETTLTATDGSDFSLTKDTTAPLTLVFFGYTHCPDICQIVMSDIASAVTRLDPEDQDKVDVLFVTSDPSRDDEATLREYLDRFNPEFEGLTGDLDKIVMVANELGVAIEEGAKMPSGGYEVAHGTQIVAVDDRDRSPIVWTEGTPAAHLAEDISALLDETESSPAS